MLFKNIKDLREDGYIKQQTLAELLGIAQKTYPQYETEKIEWVAPINWQIFIAQVFDYPLGLTDKPKLYK